MTMTENKPTTVIGTRMKSVPDMAAFANTTASRCVEMNDFYYRPGSAGGHPSDMLGPVLAILGITVTLIGIPRG